MTNSQSAAGWYPLEGQLRYWDGAAWTEHVAPLPSKTMQQPTVRAPEPSDPDALWQAVGRPLTGIGAGKYKLTNHYLFFEKGTLRTDSQQVPISAVLDVDVKQSISQKARGLGNVVVHIQRPGRIEVVVMEDISNFREGQRAINDTAHAARLAIQRNQNTMRYEGAHPAAPAAPTQGPATSAEPDLMAQLRQLGELRDAGILTEEEFSAKKAEILARI